MIYLKLRTLLTIALLFVIFLAAGFMFFRGIGERNQAQKTAQIEVEQALKVTNEKVDGFFDDVNRTLILLSSVPEVKSGKTEECNNYLRAFLRDHIQYANLGAADANGNVICSAVPLQKPVNLSDRTYFSGAKEMLLFAPGLYRINRITNTAAVSFGYPVLNGDLGNERVAFASVNVDWFKKLISDSAIREDVTITIFDKNGTVLARSPGHEQWVGTLATDKPLVKAVMAKTQGSAELEGLDGVQRYYEFLPILNGGGNNGYVTVGVSLNEAVKSIDAIYVRTISYLILTSMGIFVLNLIIDGVLKNKVNV